MFLTGIRLSDSHICNEMRNVLEDGNDDKILHHGFKEIVFVLLFYKPLENVTFVERQLDE